VATLTNVALAPSAMLFRIFQAHPLIAILVSAAAGAIAYATGHDNWMAALASFAAYMLIWMDESELHASEARKAPAPDD